MSSASNAAIAQFSENAQQFYATDLEKHNLYLGLVNLATAISGIENTLNVIIQQLLELQQTRR